MKLLMDVCLSPEWVGVLEKAGHDAIHWSSIGDVRANDREIIRWAQENERVVFTHDLDFGAILALTGASGPSVLRVRTLDVLPAAIGPTVTRVLDSFESELEKGAIVSVDESSSRVRVLPI